MKVSTFVDQITVWESASDSCESAKHVEAVVGKFFLESTAPQSLVFNRSTYV